MLKRKIDNQLVDWKQKKNKKPLLLGGARQIGKTTSVREFAKHYESFVEINFLRNPEMKAIFSGSKDLNNILASIQLAVPRNTYHSRSNLAVFR